MDYENMSDEELQAEYSKISAPAEPITNFDAMSDEELTRLYEAQVELTSDPLAFETTDFKPGDTDFEGFTIPTDVSQSITPSMSLNPDAVATEGELLSQGAEGFQLGTAKTLQGGYMQYLSAKGLVTDNEEEQAQEKEILDRLEAQSKGGFAEMLGQASWSLATLPVAYQSKIIAFLVEGGIGAAEGRGEGMDAVSANVLGLITGGLTAGVMKAVDMLGGDKVDDLYSYLKKYTNTSDAQADEIFTGWSKTMDAPDTPANRTKALVDSLGEKGAQFKIEAASGSPSATSAIEGNIKARQEAITALTEGSSKITHTAEAISEASDVVKANYALVKEHLTDTVTDIKLTIPDALDELTSGDVSAVKEILSKDSLVVGDLVDAMPHVNSLLRRTKGVTKHKWSTVKDAIDNNLKDVLTEADYSMWTKANKEYREMANVTTSSIGKVIKDVKTKKITPELAIQKIKNLSGGADLFTDMEKLIGTEQTASFEKTILKEALGKNSEEVNWAHLARVMDKKGFVTESGKNIKQAVDNVASSFLTDDVLQQIAFKNKSAGAGFSDSLVAKAKFSAMHKIYTSIVKHIPFSETAEHILKMDELTEVLRNPNMVKNLDQAVNDLTPGIKAMITEDLVNQATKQITYKPGAKQTGDVSLQPEYVTKAGTVGETPAQATLAEAQTKLLQEHLDSPIMVDQVMSTVNKLMAGKRANNILSDVSKRMKVGDAVGNQNMLQKIIKTEVDDMVKLINKDAGVKLPPQEVEKIYKLKLEELIRECQ